MRLTDEEINKAAGYHLIEDENVKSICDAFADGAKWARDKACEWVPVSRELPEYIGDYLCLCNDGVQMVCHINALGQWTLSPPKHEYGDLYGNGRKGNRKVTHWQPLPQPPKSE